VVNVASGLRPQGLTIIFVVNPGPSSKAWFVGNKKTFHPILDIGPHMLKFDMRMPVFSNIFSLNMLLSTGTELAGNKILPEKCEKQNCIARERYVQLLTTIT